MNNDYNTDYQYDRCSSRGICSINPATASLLEVIILYLKYSAFFLSIPELQEKLDKRLNFLIINTISIISSDYEISEMNFNKISATFKRELPKLISEYKNICKININKKILSESEKLLECKDDINSYIRLGEKELNKKITSVSESIRSLRKLLFILVKSLCINILIGTDYGINTEKEQNSILKVLSFLNDTQNDKEKLTGFLNETAQNDCLLMKNIRKTQAEEYGEPTEKEVSFSTRKGKAVLVIGSNLKELEIILEKLKNNNIDVYTHDNMILAHTFPKFSEYKNLVGQFGKGMENCLLDFSTFPGPIILTKHSLYNVENLYRGRLYTTDFAYSKGVVPIINNDFSKVIKSAEDSKGFKTGKTCHAAKVGFSYSKIIYKIQEKLSNEQFAHVIILGTNGYSQDEREYFRTFFSHIPENVFIITASCAKEAENIISLNTENEISVLLNLYDDVLSKLNQSITFFFPICTRHTPSFLINAALLKKSNLFIGKWDKTVLNPVAYQTLEKIYNIKEITSPKKDISFITNI